jgi:TolB-like protein/DNA-binding winged helix-turn-helix (wHTH) protein
MTTAEDTAISPGSDRPVFGFGDFSLDAAQRRLFDASGEPVHLTARAFDTLLFLVEHPNQLIDKQTLLKAVWPNVIVEENNLSQNILIVRRALHEAPDEHRFIVTVPGRGFRFVAPVKRLSAIPETHTPLEQAPRPVLSPTLASLERETTATSLSAGGGRRSKRRAARAFGVAAGGTLILALSYLLWDRTVETVPKNTRAQGDASVVVTPPTIAVLPFTDLSPNQDQRYFADGLTEELGSQIGRIPGVRVIGRRSAFAFKGRNEDLRKIGASLGVKHLLEGSIRKAGDQLRITAQLVDAADGTRLWSDTYARTVGDVFAIQDEIAKAVAVALSGTLREGDMNRVTGGTRNIAAYEAYLAGRMLVNTRSFESGIAQLERAVSLDPQFALAWGWLARAYQSGALLPERQPEKWRARQQFATARALALAPDLPAALVAAANLSMQQRKWAQAEQYLLRALVRGSDADAVTFVYGSFLLNMGRPREAMDYYRRGKLSEPLLKEPATLLAIAYEMSGQLDQADAELAATAGLVGDRRFGDLLHEMVALARRDSAQMRSLIAALPANDFSRAVQLGTNDPESARVALRRLATQDHYQRTPWVWGMAHWAAYFGDHELSLRLLRKGLGAHMDGSSALVIWRAVERETRRLPAFKDLVRDLGLVDYWRESGKWNEFCRPVGADDFECS